MFTFINLALRTVAASSWLASRAMYATGRQARRWPWTFLVICCIVMAGCYAMAGQPT